MYMYLAERVYCLEMFEDDFKTFEEASIECANIGGSLHTPRTDKEQELLANMT